jgi:hypothetical protein
MERTFRPKGSSVKAIQISASTIDYAANLCFGQKADDNGVQTLRLPSFDGVPRVANIGDYVVITKGQGVRVMPADEFEERYELVKNTRSDT